MSAMGLEGERVAGWLGLEQSERTRLGGWIGAGGSTSSPGKNTELKLAEGESGVLGARGFESQHQKERMFWEMIQWMGSKAD